MRAFCLACIVAVVGCSGSSDPAPPAHGYQIKVPSYTLAAGEEKYLCYGVALDEAAPVAITAFQSYAGAQVHHMELFQNQGVVVNGLTECDGSIQLTWLPIFGGGQSSGGLTLPDGAGFKLPANAQLILQLHLLNATTSSQNVSVIVNMDYADDASTITPAGIFAFGSMNINLPSGASMDISSSCTVPKTMNVFAVQPHMHTLGTKLTFQLGADEQSAQMVYSRDPWQFGAQPIDEWSMPITTGQFGKATCSFDNTTDHTVTYGESTMNEMCYFILFYTPFDKLDGCID